MKPRNPGMIMEVTSGGTTRPVTGPLPRYHALKCIGQGGQSFGFFRATTEEEEVVGIKVMANTPFQGLRARHEQRMMERVRDLPGVVQSNALYQYIGQEAVHDPVMSGPEYQFPPGGYLLEMEYLDGITLQEYCNLAHEAIGASTLSEMQAVRNQLLNALGFPPEREEYPARQAPERLHQLREYTRKGFRNTLIQIFRKVFVALAGIHQAGVIHRDMKKGNIIIRRDSVDPVIIDFGISRLINEPAPFEGPSDVYGNAFHFAPEIIRSEEYTPAMDVWALGVGLLYCLVNRYDYFRTGRHGSTVALMEDIYHNRTNKHFLDALHQYPKVRDLIFQTALVRDPDKRASAAEMATLLSIPEIAH